MTSWINWLEGKSWAVCNIIHMISPIYGIKIVLCGFTVPIGYFRHLAVFIRKKNESFIDCWHNYSILTHTSDKSFLFSKQSFQLQYICNSAFWVKLEKTIKVRKVMNLNFRLFSARITPLWSLELGYLPNDIALLVYYDH